MKDICMYVINGSFYLLYNQHLLPFSFSDGLQCVCDTSSALNIEGKQNKNKTESIYLKLLLRAFFIIVIWL